MKLSLSFCKRFVVYKKTYMRVFGQDVALHDCFVCNKLPTFIVDVIVKLMNIFMFGATERNRFCLIPQAPLQPQKLLQLQALHNLTMSCK